jgi:hypothetical protein
MMRTMAARLRTDAQLAERQAAAHDDYLARRAAATRQAGQDPLPTGTQSAGGMPDRVKCLHALAAHALAVPGVNPLGGEAVKAAGSWWQSGPCAGPGSNLPGCDPRTFAAVSSTREVDI